VLVPQVNGDGNDVAGIRLPEAAVPLGTYTGWNVTVPQLSELRYLSGLVGGFEPFARTKSSASPTATAGSRSRNATADRQDYLDKVRARRRRPRAPTLPARRRRAGVLQSAERMWNAIAD
jgi:hypothetical protein